MDARYIREKIAYIILVACIYILFYYASVSRYNVHPDKFYFHNYNLFLYVVGVGCCLTFSVLVFMIISKIQYFDSPIIIKLFRKCSLIFVTLFGFFVIYLLLCNENSVYSYPKTIFERESDFPFLRNVMPSSLYVFSLLLLFIPFLPSISKSQKRINKYKRYMIMIFSEILVAGYMYKPVIELNQYHFHAYIAPIINTMWGYPIGHYNQVTYGHYGILYYPLVKIFGDNYYAIIFAICVVSLFTYFCIFQSLNIWIKNDVVYCLSICTIMGINTIIYRGGKCFQVNPHRFLFPVVTIYLISLIIRENTFSKWYLRYGIAIICGALSLVWNIETGVSVLLMWCFYELYSMMKQNKMKLSLKVLARAVLYGVVFSVACIVLSYLIIAQYNVLQSYDMPSFRDYLYPIIGKGIYVESLRLPIGNVWGLHTVQVVLACIVILKWFMHIFRNDLTMEARDKEIMEVIVSISMLCSLTYYMNRFAWPNISISFVQMCILIGLLADNIIKEDIDSFNDLVKTVKNGEIDGFNIGGGCVCAFFLFLLAIESLLYLGPSLTFSVHYNMNTDNYEKLCSFVESEIPDGILAFGMSIPEVYYNLGRNPQIVISDWASMDKENFERVVDRVEKSDMFFAHENSIIFLKQFYNTDSFDDFEVISSISLFDWGGGESKFSLYVRK